MWETRKSVDYLHVAAFWFSFLRCCIRSHHQDEFQSSDYLVLGPSVQVLFFWGAGDRLIVRLPVVGMCPCFKLVIAKGSFVLTDPVSFRMKNFAFLNY